jgi:hypothetical protein
MFGTANMHVGADVVQVRNHPGPHPLVYSCPICPQRKCRNVSSKSNDSGHYFRSIHHSVFPGRNTFTKWRYEITLLKRLSTRDQEIPPDGFICLEHMKVCKYRAVSTCERITRHPVLFPRLTKGIIHLQLNCIDNRFPNTNSKEPQNIAENFVRMALCVS